MTGAPGYCSPMRRGEKKVTARQGDAGRMRVMLIRPYCYTERNDGPVANAVAQKLRYMSLILCSITHHCSGAGKTTRSCVLTIFKCLTATNFKGNETHKYFFSIWNLVPNLSTSGTQAALPPPRGTWGWVCQRYIVDVFSMQLVETVFSILDIR